MLENLLKIKTTLPPRAVNIIPRPRILHRLNDYLNVPGGVERHLTLVSAPAGSGKTTLVREWLAGKEGQAAWYSLDDNDNERERFWSYFIYALQTIKQNLGRGTLEMLRSSSFVPETPAASETFLTPLLNDLLYLEKPLYLVLDDYHLVEDSSIHEGMVFFIENMPPRLNLAVATRSDPPWPLARWRAKGRIVEIRQAELRFSAVETARYLERVMDKPLPEADLHTLYRKTEGWVTALRLLAGSLCAAPDTGEYIRNLSGDQRQIFDFLCEEVFTRQPPAVQEFLLKTSVLPRFCHSLCNAVTGREDSRELLNKLVSENLFVFPLDEQGSWYRYHPLFADLLSTYLERSPGAKTPFLHEKAGSWFLEAGEAGEAVRHFLKGKYYEQGAQVLHDYIDQLWEREGIAQLLDWLRELPGALMEKYPRLLVCRALLCLTSGKTDEARFCLELAAETEYEDTDKKDELNGMISVVRTYLDFFSGDLPAGVKYAEEALRLLPERARIWRIFAAIACGDVQTFCGDLDRAYAAFNDAYRWSRQWGNFLFVVSSGMNILKVSWLRGDLPEARRFAEAILRLAKEEGLSNMPRVGIIWIFIGEILREAGNLEEAQRCINRGMSICEPEKLLAGVGNLFQVMTSFSRGKYEETLQFLGTLENLDREATLPELVINLVLAWKARVHLEKGDNLIARDLLERLDKENMATIFFPGNMQLVLCRFLLAEKRLDQARRVLEKIQGLPHYRKSRRLIISSLLQKAHLEELRGRGMAAQECLEEALRTGKKSGFYQVFLDEGRPSAAVFFRLLKKTGEGVAALADEPGMGDYLRRICRGFFPGDIYLGEEDAGDGGQTDTNRASGFPYTEVGLDYQELVEDLSPRELEILALVSRGLSNWEISRELNLSVTTIKWHNSNIFGKLGVKNRTGAVARARDLHLL